MIITMLDPVLFKDPVMRATMGMGILKQDKNATNSIFGAALVTSAFKDMDRGGLK